MRADAEIGPVQVRSDVGVCDSLHGRLSNALWPKGGVQVGGHLAGFDMWCAGRELHPRLCIRTKSTNTNTDIPLSPWPRRLLPFRPHTDPLTWPAVSFTFIFMRESSERSRRVPNSQCLDGTSPRT